MEPLEFCRVQPYVAALGVGVPGVKVGGTEGEKGRRRCGGLGETLE